MINSARGTVTISYEEGRSAHNQVFELSLSAENSDFSSNTSYFYVIAKKQMDGFSIKYVPILRSELLSYSSSPLESQNVWKVISLPISAFLSGREERKEINDIEFQFQLYRYSKNGDHRMLGTYQNSLMEFIEKEK
jgi:hypothetical protein